MVRSNERNPASTCPTRTPSLAQTSTVATVEFTSPYTSTMSGWRSTTSGSRRIMISAVCFACVPEPTARFTSGAGMDESLHHILPLLQGIQDRSDLHEVRARSHDVKYVHRFSSNKTIPPHLFRQWRRMPQLHSKL